MGTAVALVLLRPLTPQGFRCVVVSPQALVKAYKEQLGPYVGKKPDEVFSALNPSDAPKRKADAQPTSPK